uniref:Putative ovule protein n=1 Tax=Solanum chacoense TaxID=4108 RepID=A0A0V0HT02_SOLCH
MRMQLTPTFVKVEKLFPIDPSAKVKHKKNYVKQIKKRIVVTPDYTKTGAKKQVILKLRIG